MFSNKVLLITGGTGSFGNAVIKRFLDSDLKGKHGVRSCIPTFHMLTYQHGTSP